MEFGSRDLLFPIPQVRRLNRSVIWRIESQTKLTTKQGLAGIGHLLCHRHVSEPDGDGKDWLRLLQLDRQRGQRQQRLDDGDHERAQIGYSELHAEWTDDHFIGVVDESVPRSATSGSRYITATGI
jgi:hypothetical protein